MTNLSLYPCILQHPRPVLTFLYTAKKAMKHNGEEMEGKEGVNSHVAV